jgi:hypothetical protein
MRSLAFLVLVAVAATCGPDPNARLPGYAGGNGGQSGGGGTTDSGGTIADSGGAVGTGGVGAGGSLVGSGGKVGTGGRVGSGGVAGSTGRDAGSIPRDSAAGGAASGGNVGGIAIGSGGRLGSGGATGAGGQRGDAAATTRDTAVSGPEVASNCLSAVVANSFVCGSAPPCSDCKDNSTSKAAECEAVIKCIAASYPCTGNCEVDCFNKNGGNGPVQTCVTALKTAACGGGGCDAPVTPRG